MRSLLMVAVLLALGLATVRASALVPECSALQGHKQQLATSILSSQHPYRCCDKTLAECLKQRPTCKLAERLARDVCRRVQAGEDRAGIERTLARRAASMLPGAPRASIDLSSSPPAGDPSSKVTLVAYVCPRCPYCERLMAELHKEVTSGALQGKVKLYARLFPLRGHQGSTEASLAVTAAGKLGKFWPYLMRVYQDFGQFALQKLPQYATQSGLPRDRFESLSRDASVRAELVSSKKEGVRNKVESTPTLFLNGRRYAGDLGADTVVDVLLEEHERLTGAETKE